VVAVVARSILEKTGTKRASCGRGVRAVAGPDRTTDASNRQPGLGGPRS
jgi:hypothetical protein